MTIASDPRMPIGTSRWGFFVSSAVVATTSKPMKAKKTIAAPAMTPPMPKTAGSRPKIELMSGDFQKPPSAPPVGWLGGMNGV